MALQYLDFDFSEADGCGSFDALASVAAPQLAALQAEVAQVLDWAQAQWGDLRGPLDEGGEWDFELNCQREWTADEGLAYDLQVRQFHASPAEPGATRFALSLSLSGSEQFCAALRTQFQFDGD